MSKLRKLLITIINIRKIFSCQIENSVYFDECILLGNGPSLKNDIDKIFKIKNKDVICVNRFASSSYYEKIKPRHYFVCDPAFFDTETEYNKGISIHREDCIVNNKKELENFLLLKNKLIEDIINKTKWDVIFHIPLHYIKSDFTNKISSNKFISIKYYSQISLDFKFQAIREFMYSTKIFMPLAQNVLIASLMGLIRLGYKKIYIFGADHSWHEELVLDKKNILRLKDIHFYSDELKDESELKPLISNFNTGKLVTVVEHFFAQYQMFQSHSYISKFAQKKGIAIINSSSKTWIDCYERGVIDEI